MKKNSIRKIFICSLCAVIIASFSASLVSCNGKKTESSSSESSSQSENDSKQETTKTTDTTSSEEQSSSIAKVVQGDKIKKAYEYFSGNEYTFREKITGQDKKTQIITETRKNDDFYSCVENENGKSGKIKSGKESYKFDLGCKIFSKADDNLPDNMVRSVVENKLPQTNTHINGQDTKKYDVEEYTYTGSTYITVLDFCFDKKSGELKKYTVTYQVEGKDNETETREFLEMKDKADESLLDTAFVNNLTAFDNLSEEKRAEFCRAIIEKKRINSDEMVKQGMTTDKLKTISYDDFIEFVYNSVNQKS